MLNHTEFLFAHWAVPKLKGLRGAHWNELVTRISSLPATAPDALAFALMMIHLNGCAKCDARLYRERGGCANCARYMLGIHSKEDDADLLVRFHAAQRQVADSLPEQAVE
jgi:hypothetical protein